LLQTTNCQAQHCRAERAQPTRSLSIQVAADLEMRCDAFWKLCELPEPDAKDWYLTRTLANVYIDSNFAAYAGFLRSTTDVYDIDLLRNADVASGAEPAWLRVSWVLGYWAMVGWWPHYAASPLGQLCRGS
jgi:hypothetical protein